MSIISPDAETTAAAADAPLTQDDPAVAEKKAAAPRHLSGPISDVMFLGGSSILILPLLSLLAVDDWLAPVAAIAYWMSYLVNSPHFAVSYQMFYSGFGDKVRGVGYEDSTLKIRYLMAGVVIPVALAISLAIPFLAGSATSLGYGLNLMLFVVGWHYVKQGYGMAMVDAALKRQYFNDREKKVMRVNGYAIWMLSWILAQRFSEREDYFGIPIQTIPVSSFLVGAAVLVAIGTSIATAIVLGQRVRSGHAVALAGTIAYVVSLYVWLLAVRANPLFAFVIPGLHSLQYLHVVRRYQKNRESSGATRVTWANQYMRAIVLGMLMFVVVPLFLDRTMSYDRELFGPSAFMFMILIFVNVHHYCLDNVMWRRGNPDVSKHLFAAH